MKDNTRIAIGYVCITLVLCFCVLAFAWSMTTEWTMNINITADDNLLNMTKTAERMQERQYELKKECWENDKLIPCVNFTSDEHFCADGICKVNGICPDYYEILEGKTTGDCIYEIEGRA